MNRRLPVLLDANLSHLTPEVPHQVFSETFRTACYSLDLFVQSLVVKLATQLELPFGRAVTAPELAAERGWVPAGTLALEWLLENLELYGLAQRDDKGIVLLSTPALRDPEEIQTKATAVLPAVRPSFEIMSRAATAMPAVLRGEMRGEDALFGPATLSLWFDYFSNRNPLYYPNNAITAVAVARHARPGLRVLEVGGGGGSCAEAVLAFLAATGIEPSLYCFTELHPAFLRQGTRLVRSLAPPNCTVVSKIVDINCVPPLPDLADEPFDLVLGVNTLHLAKDIVATLKALRQLLSPGGVLVLGEVLRPLGSGAVHLELPFALLESYRDVILVDGVRRRPGFLTADGWQKALAIAGFAGSEVIPAQLARCVEAYPGFYAGAVVARTHPAE